MQICFTSELYQHITVHIQNAAQNELKSKFYKCWKYNTY